MKRPHDYGASRILVVDDENATRTSLAEILRLEGHQIATAPNGDIACELIYEYASCDEPFDLVLLDLKMPGKDGLDVLKVIEQSYPDPNDIHRPSVILLTAHGSLETAIEGLRFGAHDYLLKPSSPDQIIDSVCRALKLHQEQIKKLTTAQEFIDSDGNHFDLTRREISYQNANGSREVLKLTPTEGKLMRVFLENPQRVFYHRELVALVHGYDLKNWEAAGILRPSISRLRQKLMKVPGGIDWIKNIRGTGYSFEHNVR